MNKNNKQISVLDHFLFTSSAAAHGLLTGKILVLVVGMYWSSNLVEPLKFKTTQTSPSTQTLPSNGPDRSQLTNHSDPLWALLGPLSKPLKCRTMTLFATSVQVSTTSLYL